MSAEILAVRVNLMDHAEIDAILKRYETRDDEFAQLVRRLCAEIQAGWNREAAIQSSHNKLTGLLCDIHKLSKFW